MIGDRDIVYRRFIGSGHEDCPQHRAGNDDHYGDRQQASPRRLRQGSRGGRPRLSETLHIVSFGQVGGPPRRFGPVPRRVTGSRAAPSEYVGPPSTARPTTPIPTRGAPCPRALSPVVEGIPTYPFQPHQSTLRGPAGQLPGSLKASPSSGYRPATVQPLPTGASTHRMVP